MVFENNDKGLVKYSIDGYLKSNLDEFVNFIKKDFMFVILISGSGGVRVGKSVLGMQTAYYLVNQSNIVHGFNNTFTLDNVVYTGQDLIDKSLPAPRGSAFVLDEGDDLLEGYWAKVTRDLKRYFRKAGQLNQFVIIITPNFFSLPIEIATNYSTILLDCYFTRGFERGSFRFFNKDKKRQLYLRGKKEQDYNAALPNFVGTFPNIYPLGEQEYREKKKRDLDRMASAPKETRADVRASVRLANSINALRNYGKTFKEIGEMMDLSEDNVSKIWSRHYNRDEGEKPK